MKPVINMKVSITFFSCLICFVLVSCPTMGQAKQKKLLAPVDYHLWSVLESGDISGSGRWVSYFLRYRSGTDTLFVKRNDGKRTFTYPLGGNGKFCNDRWYACRNGEKLTLTNLETGKSEVFQHVRDYEFSGNGNFFLIEFNEGTEKRIAIRYLLTGASQTIKGVSAWSFNREKTKLAYGLRNGADGSATVLGFGNSISELAGIAFPKCIVSTIVWQENSGSIACVLQSSATNTTKLAQYLFAAKTTVILDPSGAVGFSKDKHIESPDAERLKISDDGKRLFFQEVPNVVSAPVDSPVVEVWHGDDKILYSEQMQYGNLKEWNKTAIWYTDTNEVFEFMPGETHVKLSGDQHYALTSSLEPCGLQFRYAAKRDYYLINLVTKERRLFLSCHSPELAHTLLSPDGKYIVYYKDGNWHNYTIASGVHKNLTVGLASAFYDESNDTGDQPGSYGVAGWTSSLQSIIIYDKFDIWEVSLTGGLSRRLTKGRESNISFRIAKTDNALQPSFNSVPEGNGIDLNEPLTLSSSLAGGSMQGFSILYGGKVSEVVFRPKHISGVKRASVGGKYIFLEEDYRHPPSLKIVDKHKVRTLYESNPQHKDYFWGKVETVSYLGEDGSQLKGLLYYPSDYKMGTGYPMVVNVYQIQSDRLHYYRNPANAVYNGFDLFNFVNNGYFVLLPDIKYRLGAPGDSAVFCVTAAINEVLKYGNVDTKGIGLIGHSFGGFESSYIITRSNLFAAAVAGAAQTDHIAGYLTVSENYKRAEYWRFEYYTNRMKKPLFEDLDTYIYNSPVFSAPTIQTPLLLWTGAKDGHVAPTQSMELYLAMRRLGKKVTLLRYPKEDHNLEDIGKQGDLSTKIVEWFDYYLKGGQKKNWM
jgi:dipeptidyl aminopeptidase/acylaminoacyl peptidase